MLAASNQLNPLSQQGVRSAKQTHDTIHAENTVEAGYGICGYEITPHWASKCGGVSHSSSQLPTTITSLYVLVKL